MTAVFDSSEGELLKKFIDLGLELAAKRAILSSAHRIVGVITTEIVPALEPPPIDRRIYVAGWRAKKTDEGADFFNTTPHAPFIEHGVRPGRVRPGPPMLKALVGWVRRKGIAGRGKGKKAKDEAVEVASAIMWSLRAKGIFNEGQGFDVVGKAKERLPKILAAEWLREVKKEFK